MFIVLMTTAYYGEPEDEDDDETQQTLSKSCWYTSIMNIFNLFGYCNCLAIKDLLDVLEQLSDLTASKYWRLGLKLGLLAPTLNQLESTHNEDLGRHVMVAWLNQEDNVVNPTWKRLIAALQSQYVGQSVTAQRVRQRL